MSNKKLSKQDRVEYGKRLKTARKTRDLTQTELAEAVGIRQSVISSIESGNQSISSHGTKIANELEINAMWLNYGVGDMESSNDTVINTFLVECFIVVIEKSREHDPSMRQIATIVETIYNEGKHDRSINLSILEPMLKILGN